MQELSFRHSKLKFFSLGFSLYLTIIANFSACSEKPKKKVLDSVISLDFIAHKDSKTFPKGLWFTGLNFVNGGYLGRLDLETGSINRSLLKIGPDTIVLPDSTQDGLLLLNRGGQEALARLVGVKAEMEFTQSLPQWSNPQSVVRDSRGNIWVTFLELNEVRVYSPDLKNELAKVDLSNLGLKGIDGKGNADLGPMAMMDDKTIIIAAQRLHREKSWSPVLFSGLALINIDNFQLESTQLVALPNPILLSKDRVHDQTILIGRGDYVDPAGAMGQYAIINDKTLSLSSSTLLEGKVVAADEGGRGDPPALIVLYPSENKSCVQRGSIKIICEINADNGGYVFSSIRQSGNIIFASYYGHQSSELWILTLPKEFSSSVSVTSTEVSLQKIPMDLPIFSLSFGP